MSPGWGDQDAVVPPGIPFLLQRCKAIIQAVEFHRYHAWEPGLLSRLGTASACIGREPQQWKICVLIAIRTLNHYKATNMD